MDRRRFLKLSAGAVATAVVAPIALSAAANEVSSTKLSFARATPTSLGGSSTKVCWCDIVSVPNRFPPVGHAYTLEDYVSYHDVEVALENLVTEYR